MLSLRTITHGQLDTEGNVLKRPALTAVGTIAIALFLTLAISSGTVEAQETYSGAEEPKVNETLSQMTLDEKIKMLSGTPDQMHVPGVPRLNIPELQFSDGPVGVRVYGRSTAYPCGAMLAAAWDRSLAQTYGESLGDDCLARGVHVLLAPGVDLYRVPQCGRNFEYFGEDPYLAGQLAVSYINGVQKKHVVACVKHYAANDQETLRDSINTIIDERRLHEVCLPPFEEAVTHGVWTIMAAYNKVNGFWCTANKELMSDILRKQWNFCGVAMSDWGAVHEFLGPFTAGTDLEMGTTTYYTADNIKHALDAGKIKLSDVDDKVRRLLRMSLSMGFIDHTQHDKSIPLDYSKSVDTAMRAAANGLTLLKNDDKFLPLDRATTKHVVVLGPNACPAVTGGGGSSYTDPFHAISLYDAIVGSAHDSVNVEYIPSYIDKDPTSKLVFTYHGMFEPVEAQHGQRGVAAEYYDNVNLQGEAKTKSFELSPNHWWGEGHPTDEIKTPSYSVRWTGKIKPAQTDDYVLAVQSDGARVFLDGKPILETNSEKLDRRTIKLNLKQNETHDLAIEYRHLGGKDAAMQFEWSKADEAFTPDEQSKIREADAIVYAAGFNPGLESEGFDRPYELPGNQEADLKAIAQLNPKILVVVNAGGNVAMEHWIDSVKGLMYAWYPGQIGNLAIAQALFGDLNPSGHLPDTFEKRWEDSPAYGNYPGDLTNGGTIKYTEGIYTGYRWYDKKNIAPRFPFGYGLSYTTFNVGSMKTQLARREQKRDAKITIDAKVTNTGARAGSCVVQLYVRPPKQSKIDRPVQELKEFARVDDMNPGETRDITFTLTQHAFESYDEQKHDWIYPPGDYEIALGTSSRDICCTHTINYDGF
jgi:beta-glucosidase